MSEGAEDATSCEDECHNTQDAVDDRERYPLIGEDKLHGEESEDQASAPEREAQIQQEDDREE